MRAGKRWNRAGGTIAMLAVALMAASATGRMAVQAAGQTSGARGSAGNAAAGVQRVLVMNDLTERKAEVLGISAAGVLVRESTGRVRTIPLAEIAAVLPEAGAGGNGGWGNGSGRLGLFQHGTLRLTDGQVWPGDPVWEGVEVAPERVMWEATALGRVEIDLERVRVMVMPAGEGEEIAVETSRGEEDATKDAVILKNGDRVEGFVAAVGRKVVVEGDGPARDIETAGVREIRLANPAGKRPRVMAYLRDGTAAGAELTSSGAGTGLATLTLVDAKAGKAAWPLVEVVGLSVRGDELRALAGLELKGQRAVDARRWLPPVRVGEGAVLGVADVEIPGPMEVEWALPKGAARVAFEVELSAGGRGWADVTVEVSAVRGAERTALVRERLNDERTALAVNADVTGATGLVVKVEAGAGGALRDTVLIRRGLVRVAE